MFVQLAFTLDHNNSTVSFGRLYTGKEEDYENASEITDIYNYVVSNPPTYNQIVQYNYLNNQVVDSGYLSATYAYIASTDGTTTTRDSITCGLCENDFGVHDSFAGMR